MARYILYCLFYFTFLPSVFLQPAIQNDTLPKVGIALSGGGAKGLAHIGFLQVLEQAGVVPDFITGVSMGSLVGGMYASGYRADVIAREFRRMDYELILSDKFDESTVYFDEKALYRNKLLPFSIEDGRFKSPGGLIHGQYITTLMDYFSWPVNRIRDFTKFPIPYKTVGTNIETCTARVFDQGNFSDAMRASMAVPLAFSPVEIDDSLYVDGGVVKNLAVSDLREMGADIIIASYTGGELQKKERLNAAPNISTQLMSFSGIYESKAQKKDADLVIDYAFGNLSAMDFYSYDSLINLGYFTALEYMDDFKEIARKQRAHQKKIKIPELALIQIDTILIHGNKLHSDEQILQQLNLKKGYYMNHEIMKEKMTHMYGLFLFDKINYEIKVVDGKNQLHIKCLEKARNWLNFSIHYDSYLNFGVNLNYVHRNFLLPDSRISLNAFLAEKYRLHGQYQVHFGGGHKWSTTLDASYYKESLPGLRTDNIISQVNTDDLSTTLSLRYDLSSNSRVGIKNEYRWHKKEPVIKQDFGWERETFQHLLMALQYQRIDLDDYYFSSSGMEVDVQLSTAYLLKASREYQDNSLNLAWGGSGDLFRDLSLKIRSRFHWPVSKSTSIAAQLNAFLSLGQEDFIHDFVLVGGFRNQNQRALPFMGFHANEWLVRNALGTGLSVQQELFRDGYINVFGHAYLMEDTAKDEFLPYFGLATELAYKSIIGPLKIGIMHGFYPERGVFDPVKYYISLGYLLQ